MQNNNISVKVCGNPDSNAGFQPLILFNSPRIDIQDKGYAGFDNCPFFFTIRKYADRSVYKLVKNNVRSHGATRAGSLEIAFSIPKNHKLDNGLTPYDVLVRLKDEFISKCMTLRDPVLDIYEFSSPRIDQNVLDDFLKQFTVSPQMMPDRKMAPGGPVGYIVKDDQGIRQLFTDTDFPEFDRFSEVIVASDATNPNYIPVQDIQVPRQKTYKVICDGKLAGVCTDPDGVIKFTSNKNPKYYDNETVEFTIRQLKNGEFSHEGITLNEATEEVSVSTRNWDTPKQVRVALDFNHPGARQFFLANTNLLKVFTADGRRVNLANDLSFTLLGEEIALLDGIRASVLNDPACPFRFVNSLIAGDQLLITVEEKKRQEIPPHQPGGQNMPRGNGYSNNQRYGNANIYNSGGAGNQPPYDGSGLKNYPGTGDNQPPIGRKPKLLNMENKDSILVFASIAAFLLLVAGFFCGYFSRPWIEEKFFGSKEEITSSVAEDPISTSAPMTEEKARAFLAEVTENLNNASLTFDEIDSIYKQYTENIGTIKQIGDDNAYAQIEYYNKIVQYIKNDNIDSLINQLKTDPEFEGHINSVHNEILKKMAANPGLHKEITDISNFTELNDLYMYHCPECDYTSETKEELDKHILKEHPTFDCDQCNKTFGTKEELTKHKTDAHKPTPANATTSDKPTQTTPSAKTQKFTCEICGKDTWFKTEKELKVHKKEKHNER